MRIWHPEELSAKGSLLWAPSDEQWQRLRGLKQEEGCARRLGDELRIVVLLVDVTVQSASTYYESEITCSAFRTHERFMKEGAVLFATGQELGLPPSDFYGHLEKKIVESPATGPLSRYRSPEAAKLARELMGTGNLLHRYGDVSLQMGDIWTSDLLARHDPHSLYWILELAAREHGAADSLRGALARLPQERGQTSFTWQYVEPRLKPLGLPGNVVWRISERHELFYLYAMSANTHARLADAGSLGIKGAGRFLDSVSPFDHHLFLALVARLGVRSQVLCLSDREVLTLRENPTFRRFLINYRAAIRCANGFEQAFRLAPPRSVVINAPYHTSRHRALAALAACAGHNVEERLLNKMACDAILHALDRLAQSNEAMVEVVVRDVYRAILGSQEEARRMTTTRESRLRRLSTAIGNRERILAAVVSAPPEYEPLRRADASLIVARRYNSWYPSYFDVDGGCYAIFLAEPAEGKPRCIVVDPGFRFLRPLRTIGVLPCDVDTIIISHFHPDHMGGLFEYLAVRHAIGELTRVYMNPTTYDAFRSLGSQVVEVIPIRDQAVDIAEVYKRADGRFERVSLQPFQTNHTEMCQDSRSLGLTLRFDTCPAADFAREVRTLWLGLLGDTSFDAEDVHLASKLDGCDVVVLHLGSMQERLRRGKHLYLNGLERILRHIDTRIDQGAAPDKLVLISEFGLEHADEATFWRKSGYRGDQTIEPEISPLVELQGWASTILQRGWVLVADLGLEVRLVKPAQINIKGALHPPAKIAVSCNFEEGCLAYSVAREA